MADLHPEVEKLLAEGPQPLAYPQTPRMYSIETPEEFARRVALHAVEKEREECALVCDAYSVEAGQRRPRTDFDEGISMGADQSAERIRRRGKP